jgi:hypothetical protein
MEVHEVEIGLAQRQEPLLIPLWDIVMRSGLMLRMARGSLGFGRTNSLNLNRFIPHGSNFPFNLKTGRYRGWRKEHHCREVVLAISLA